MNENTFMNEISMNKSFMKRDREKDWIKAEFDQKGNSEPKFINNSLARNY